MKLASSALDSYTNTNSLPTSYNPFFCLFRVAARSFGEVKGWIYHWCCFDLVIYGAESSPLHVSEVYVDMVLDEAGLRLVEL